MKMIRPLVIDDTILVSSNVVESEPVYSAGTAYALNDVVRGVGAATHLAYRSAQASNTGHSLTDLAWWTPIGATNRWKRFDQSPQSQTTSASGFADTYAIPGRIDSLALLNVSAASVSVTMTDAVEGVVFNQTFSLESDSGITDWYAYFFEPVERARDLLLIGELPPYSDTTLNVVISDPGQTPAVGLCILGLSKDMGGTEWGGSVGIVDYSRKVVDDFGNATWVQRAYAKIGNFTVLVPSGGVDRLLNLLADYRAVPVLYVADEDYAATAIYGAFKTASTVIAYPTMSLLSIELEGLA